MTISTKRFITALDNELRAIRGFEINVKNHMEAMAEATEQDHLVGLAKSIAYNKRHIEIHLARAEALLDLACFGEPDGLTPDRLEEYIIHLEDIC